MARLLQTCSVDGKERLVKCLLIVQLAQTRYIIQHRTRVNCSFSPQHTHFQLLFHLQHGLAGHLAILPEKELAEIYSEAVNLVLDSRHVNSQMFHCFLLASFQDKFKWVLQILHIVRSARETSERMTLTSPRFRLVHGAVAI